MELRGRQVCADSASGVAKAGLPKHRQVEYTLYQDHGREAADRVPGKQAAFRTRQQAVRESCAYTASVQVDDLAVLTTREDHTPAKCVPAVMVDQTDLEQQVERIAEGGQMAM